MKFPITDQFLWDLFNLSEKVSDIFYLLGPKPWREVGVHPMLSAKRLYEKRKARQSFAKFVRYLKRKGYIEVKGLKPHSAIAITQKGMEKILKIALKSKKRKRRKDGKLIMVIFDIPERRRDLRNLFRETLHLLGFKLLQKSVWISPYDVLEEIQKIMQRYDLEEYVKIFLIEELEI